MINNLNRRLSAGQNELACRIQAAGIATGEEIEIAFLNRNDIMIRNYKQKLYKLELCTEVCEIPPTDSWL